MLIQCRVFCLCLYVDAHVNAHVVFLSVDVLYLNAHVSAHVVFLSVDVCRRVSGVFVSSMLSGA